MDTGSDRPTPQQLGDATVRPARAADLASVAEIYNAGIRARTATFETAERAVADITPWLSDAHPFLVATISRASGVSDEEETVVGWIRASQYRPRECYRGIGDFSVYVAQQAQRRGVGELLMHSFLPACTAQGYWKLVSRIFPENYASLALCERHGFRRVGVYRKHAQLDGAWRDVVIVERLLIR